jgi:hypothetical protein
MHVSADDADDDVDMAVAAEDDDDDDVDMSVGGGGEGGSVGDEGDEGLGGGDDGAAGSDFVIVCLPTGDGGLRVAAFDVGTRTAFTGVTATHGMSGTGRDTGDPAARAHGQRELAIKIQMWQYASACGFTAGAAWLRGHLHSYTGGPDVGIVAPGWLVRECRRIPTGKTSCFARYMLFVRARLCLLRHGKLAYGDLACRRSRFRKFCLQQRQLLRMAQLFAWGYTSVRGVWLQGMQPSSMHTKPVLSVVGISSAGGGGGGIISRMQGAPRQLFIDFFRRSFQAQNPNAVHLYVVN